MLIAEFFGQTDDEVISTLAAFTPIQVAERLLRVRDHELATARALQALAAKVADLETRIEPLENP